MVYDTEQIRGSLWHVKAGDGALAKVDRTDSHKVCFSH